MNVTRVCGGLLAVVGGIAPAAAEEVPPSPLSAIREELDIGPLTLTLGPQENGDFGAILSGGDSIPLGSPPTGTLPQGRFWLQYGAAEYELDAAWSSGSQALNQTSLSLKPQMTFVALTRKEMERLALSPDQERRCAELEQQMEANPDTFDLEGFMRECPLIPGIPRQHFAISLIGDVLYRYGEFEVDGERYRANQLLFGGGVRMFLPQATRTGYFREPPRLTLMYYSVADSARSNVPVPEDIELDTFSGNARLKLRWPHFPKLHLDVDMRASRNMEGASRDWQVFRELQLSYDTGDRQWKPAVTYRSGDDKGLEYDRQVILGVLFELLR